MIVVLYMICVSIFVGAAWLIYGSDAAFVAFIACLAVTGAALSRKDGE